VTPAQPSWLSLSVPCGRSSALDPCCGAPVRAPQLALLGLSALVTARLASLRRSFPARVTYHPRWLSRGFASPQHIRRDRSSSRRRRPSGRDAAACSAVRLATCTAACSLDELRPWGLITPATACSRSCLAEGGEAFHSAREILPSELFRIRIGTGLPARALRRFLGGVPYARCGSASGLCPPDEVPRGPRNVQRPSGAPLGFPFQAFSFAALALGLFSRAILLRASRSATLRPAATRRPGVLRNSERGLSVSGCQPAWDSRPLAILRPVEWAHRPKVEDVYTPSVPGTTRLCSESRPTSLPAKTLAHLY